jgi:hypothetical protein
MSARHIVVETPAKAQAQLTTSGKDAMYAGIASSQDGERPTVRGACERDRGPRDEPRRTGEITENPNRGHPENPNRENPENLDIIGYICVVRTSITRTTTTRS